jgi:hypothetical protein
MSAFFAAMLVGRIVGSVPAFACIPAALPFVLGISIVARGGHHERSPG